MIEYRLVFKNGSVSRTLKARTVGQIWNVVGVEKRCIGYQLWIEDGWSELIRA